MQDRGHGTIEKRNRALQRLEAVYVPIDSIKPNDYNSNRETDEAFELLKRSMTEDGFTAPIICDESSREIVDGEHRWRAANELNAEAIAEGKAAPFLEIPVAFVDWPEEQRRIATLRHNRAHGEEDVGLATDVLRDLQELGAGKWAQDSLMISDAELNKLLQETSAADLLAGDSFSPAWVPTSEEKTAELTEEFAADSNSSGMMTSRTEAAAELQRDAARRLEEASTSEERAAINKAVKVFPINLMFKADEAVLVRKVLGDAPAQRLLELCKAEGAG